MKPETLKSIEVLRSMDPEALAGLAAALEETSLTEGQVIFAEDDPGNSMFFILSGQIRIQKRATTTGPDQKILTVLEAGDYFGEMSLLDQKPRSASAVAAGPTKVLRLSASAFNQLQKSGGSAGLSMLFAMIRTSSERIRRLSAQLVVYDEVGKAIGEARNLQSLLDVILQQLASATNTDWGLLVLRSQFSDQLEVRALTDLLLTPQQTAAVAAGEGFIGAALQTPENLIIPDFEACELFKPCKRLGFETPSLILSPISVEAALLGLVVLGGRARDQFDLDALNLVRGIGRQTAQAILNARHREEEEARSRHSRQFVRF